MNKIRIFKSTNCVPFVASVRKAGVSTILAILGLLGSTGAHAANPIVYSSGFEEASIAPFWTVTAAFGSASLSKDFAYDGTHSIKFESSPGGQREISLAHSFGVSTRGTVSVAFYDYAPGQETLYEHLTISNSKSPEFSVAVGTMDFDSECYTAYMVTAAGTELGPNALCGIYPQTSTTPVKRTLGWHILTIAAGTTSTEIAIDGQTVFVGPVCYFDTIQFVVSGPSWRPDTSAYIDGFSFTPLSY